MSRKTLLVATLAAGLCMAGFTTQASAHDEPVAGSLIGAGIGAALGGPPGAAVGAVLGAAIGATVAHETDHGKAVRREPRHYSRARVVQPYRERVRYVAPASYNGNVGGSASATVYCEPERTYYKPKIVHRDDRAQWVPAPARQKVKMKKVCRYVPAANVTMAAK